MDLAGPQGNRVWTVPDMRMCRKFALDICDRCRAKQPLVATVAKRWVKFWTLVSPSGDRTRESYNRIKRTLFKLCDNKQDTVSGCPTFTIDLRPYWCKTPIRNTSSSLSKECTFVAFDRPNVNHPCSGLARIRTAIVPRCSSPILGEKPLELEPEELPEDLQYSIHLSPEDKLGVQFFYHQTDLFQAHLTTSHVRSTIINSLLCLETIYEHNTYLTYKTVPMCRGGKIHGNGFLYKSGYLGDKSNELDSLLLELLPSDTLFDSSQAVALCRVMREGDKIPFHKDDPNYGPAIVFVTLQPAAANDFTVGALKFNDKYSTFVVPSDPSRAFCFFGTLRTKWFHGVEPILNSCQPRITITYRLWGNEPEQWCIKN